MLRAWRVLASAPSFELRVAVSGPLLSVAYGLSLLVGRRTQKDLKNLTLWTTRTEEK